MPSRRNRAVHGCCHSCGTASIDKSLGFARWQQASSGEPRRFLFWTVFACLCGGFACEVGLLIAGAIANDRRYVTTVDQSPTAFSPGGPLWNTDLARHGWLIDRPYWPGDFRWFSLKGTGLFGATMIRWPTTVDENGKEVAGFDASTSVFNDDSIRKSAHFGKLYEKSLKFKAGPDLSLHMTVRGLLKQPPMLTVAMALFLLGGMLVRKVAGPWLKSGEGCVAGAERLLNEHHGTACTSDVMSLRRVTFLRRLPPMTAPRELTRL